MEVYFGGRRPVGKPSGRWGDAVWRDAVDLLQRAAARKKYVCRKEIV